MLRASVDGQRRPRHCAHVPPATQPAVVSGTKSHTWSAGQRVSWSQPLSRQVHNQPKPTWQAVAPLTEHGTPKARPCQSGGGDTKKTGKLSMLTTGPPGIDAPTVQVPSACAVIETLYMSPSKTVSPAGPEQMSGVMAWSSAGSGRHTGCPLTTTLV